MINNKRKSILVYPEGKRNLKNYSLKLKKGFLLYSYKTKIPIQIFITKNKENVYNERKIESAFNIELKTKYSKLIDPNKYNNFEDFYIEINNIWNNLWNDIYNNNITDEYIYKNLNDNNYYNVNNNIFFIIIFLLSNFLILYIYFILCYYYKIFIIHPLLVILN